MFSAYDVMFIVRVWQFRVRSVTCSTMVR